jgi:hypothetical protein
MLPPTFYAVFQIICLCMHNNQHALTMPLHHKSPRAGPLPSGAIPNLTRREKQLLSKAKKQDRRECVTYSITYVFHRLPVAWPPISEEPRKLAVIASHHPTNGFKMLIHTPVGWPYSSQTSFLPLRVPPPRAMSSYENAQIQASSKPRHKRHAQSHVLEYSPSTQYLRHPNLSIPAPAHDRNFFHARLRPSHVSRVSAMVPVS